MISKSFDKLVGQDAIKKRLSVYLNSYKTGGGNLPFINFIAAAGNGKTEFCRTFRENLKRPDGSRPPMVEVNCSTINKTADFFDQVYPTWVQEKGFLFLDEGHNLPSGLQEILLSVLNTEKNKVRTITFGGNSYVFDFNELSLALGTTDQQKLCRALRSRLTDISFSSYSEDELLRIFKSNLGKLKLCKTAEQDVKDSFRGDPRDAVLKTIDLKHFSNAVRKTLITKEFWVDYCDAMGILPYGLNNGELQVLKAIGSRGECSLNDITAITGLSRSAVQKEYEILLIRKGLMKIDQKRKLTRGGSSLYYKVK